MNGRIINDLETEITHLRKQEDRNCACCKQLTPYMELVEIDYLTYSQHGEFMAPNERTTEIICNNCIDEHY